MEILSRDEHEKLPEFVDRYSRAYSSREDKLSKKSKGQFFTPLHVAEYMAGLDKTEKKSVSILDPGAGLGILSVSLIEKLSRAGRVEHISLTCYETDGRLLPHLRHILKETQKSLGDRISMKSSVISKDFVSSNANILAGNSTLRGNFDKPQRFDIIISNPPYSKVHRNDAGSGKLGEVLSGQPNMYSLFMAISAGLLNKNGSMIFITPRSFCSGLYYNRFRRLLVETLNFETIHLFDSRKELFSSEKVLQETVITKLIKKENDKILISKSFGGDFSDVTRTLVSKNDVVYRTNGHIFFRIPSDREELRAVRRLDRLAHTFYDLGVKISTGKVVAFRNRNYLKKTVGRGAVPFLWMHNITDNGIRWPVSRNGKEIAIENNKKTARMLLKPGNYLLLKRFSTKEQKKRFCMAPVYTDTFKNEGYFGLDNMVNYIHGEEQTLDEDHIRGIARYLNLPVVELYFRALNGHTQVNASEVCALPFPSLQELESLGKNGGVHSELLNVMRVKGLE